VPKFETNGPGAAIEKMTHLGRIFLLEPETALTYQQLYQCVCLCMY